MRHPAVLRACVATSWAERRGVPTDYVHRRGSERPVADLADRGDGLRVSIHEVPVAPGVTVPMAVYRCDDAVTRPVHLHLHGGGFSYGSARDLDLLLREFAQAGLVAAAPNYRLAPEHPFPVPVEDAYACLAWLATQAPGGAGAPSIGGVSAGGCLAASVTLLARDRGGPAPVAQLLETPITDLTAAERGAGSMRRYARGYLLTRDHLLDSYALYAPDPADRRRPRVSPLLEPDLAGLPPAMIVTARYDPLRDEGEAYAERLRAAGVPVTVIRAGGHVHASLHVGLASARRHRAAMADWLRAAHEPRSPR